MIQRKEAEMQILRLSTLQAAEKFFGEKGEFVETELTDVLATLATNREHASRIISTWLSRSSRYLPTAEHIVHLASECDQEFDPRSWRCTSCLDTGFCTAYQLHTWESAAKKEIQIITQEQYLRLRKIVRDVPGEQYLVEVVERCMRCQLGRDRAEAVRIDLEERRAKANAKTTAAGSGR